MPIVAKARPEAISHCVNKAERDEEIAAIAKALAHPARIHIVRLLLEKNTCIGCDIVDEVGLAQSTVSEHLRVLKAGVIEGRIEHPRVCYTLCADRLVPLASLLNLVFEKDKSGELKGYICCPPEAFAQETI